jgi:NAD(P)-dependent dehydrogenase (short-subunit alcohol dehydrogenase family)
VVGVDLSEGAEGELALVADVSDEDQVRGMYERAAEEMGRIDVLFNNAGISPDDDVSVLDTSLEAWQRVQDVNLRSVFLCCKHGIPHLLDADGGSVINTASFVAVMGATTSQISYTASKGGVLALSRELGIEFGRRGVRVNALCPGPVNTPLLQELFAKDPEKAPRRLVHLPMGRFAEAREIAQGALFLASDDSSYVTASTFLVDGGLSGPTSLPNSVDEAPAELAAELVPRRDPLGRLGAERVGIEADPDGVLVLAPSVDPVVRVRLAHLRVELDTPCPLSEAVGLRAGGAAGEHGGARGWDGLIAVPLERAEARRHRADHRVVGGLGQHRHLEPADLGRPRPAHLAARRLGEELGAEAGSEQRHPAVQQFAQEHLLAREPPVLVLLVGVHRPAEGEDRVVARRVARGLGPLGDRPLIEDRAVRAERLREHAGSGVGLVDDGEGAHRAAVCQRRRALFAGILGAWPGTS